jgi:hypothetical protein
MPIFREIALAVSALAIFLFLSNAFLGPDERQEPSPTSDRPWIGAEFVPAERWLAKETITTGRSWKGAEPVAMARGFIRELTPHARIKGVFAQFVPSESRRAI